MGSKNSTISVLCLLSILCLISCEKTDDKATKAPANTEEPLTGAESSENDKPLMSESRSSELGAPDYDKKKRKRFRGRFRPRIGAPRSTEAGEVRERKDRPTGPWTPERTDKQGHRNADRNSHPLPKRGETDDNPEHRTEMTEPENQRNEDNSQASNNEPTEDPEADVTADREKEKTADHKTGGKEQKDSNAETDVHEKPLNGEETAATETTETEGKGREVANTEGE